MLKSAKDLKAADYNPRTITKTQLNALQKSIENFGDLSTIVFNERTKTLVAGHQRVKTLSKWPSRIKTQPASDEYGTVRMGHIAFKTDRGVINVPLRVVDWDLTKEKQANIAANTHGGDFDRQKLATLVAELETGDMDIDLLGIDVHDLALLQRMAPKDLDENETINSATESNNHDDTEEGEFESVVDKAKSKSKELIQCPRCSLRFQPK